MLKALFILNLSLYTLSLFISPAQAADCPHLEGHKYCRIVEALPKNPALDFKHCVGFFEGRLHDNADSFFGNPPSSWPYIVNGAQILIVRSDSTEAVPAYKCVGGHLENDAGAILEPAKE